MKHVNMLLDHWACQSRIGTILCSSHHRHMIASLQTEPNHALPHDPPIDDRMLMMHIGTGCEDCFAILFRRYWKMVFAIGFKVLRQRNEAEDVVQEVFLLIYTKRGFYDPSRASVKTWIGQFAQFRALSRRRSILVAERRQSDDVLRFEQIAATRSQAQCPERSALLGECLSALNPRQRRTVEAVAIQGHTLHETATLFNETVANTKNLYYRGMQAIRVTMCDARPRSGKSKIFPRFGTTPMLHNHRPLLSKS